MRESRKPTFQQQHPSPKQKTKQQFSIEHNQSANEQHHTPNHIIMIININDNFGQLPHSFKHLFIETLNNSKASAQVHMHQYSVERHITYIMTEHTIQMWEQKGFSFIVGNSRQPATFPQITEYFSPKKMKSIVSRWINDFYGIIINTVTATNHPDWLYNNEGNCIANLKTPLSPPDIFMKSSKKYFNNDQISTRREVYNRKRVGMSDKKKFDFNNNHYVDGALYKGICYDNFQILEGDNFNIDIDLLDGRSSVVKVRQCPRSKLPKIVRKSTSFFEKLITEHGNARRHISTSNGSKMFAFGESGDGKEYEIHGHFEDKKIISQFAKAVEDGLTVHYGDILEGIRASEVSICNIHNLGKFSRSMDVSHNLGNPAHFDRGDGGPGVAMWLKKDENSTFDNWWFLLPNVSSDGEKGIAIKLQHGLCIQWEGSIIKHCTAVPNIDEGDTFFGVFFGPKLKLSSAQEGMTELPIINEQNYNK